MPLYRFKVVVVGDGGVGKTTLILRFTEKRYRESYIPTIGVQFTVKHAKHDGKDIELILYDIAGQDIFHAIRPSFYQGSNAAVVAFDLTNKFSFTNVKNWYTELRQYLGDIPIILMGNKIDLADQRQVDYDTAKKVADEFNIQYLETSAKTGDNVYTLFKSLIGESIKQAIDARTPMVPIELVPSTPEIHAIIDDLKDFVKENGRVPLLIDKVNKFYHAIFQNDPFSPLLKEIEIYRTNNLENYPHENFSPIDKANVLTKLDEWENIHVT